MLRLEWVTRRKMHYQRLYDSGAYEKDHVSISIGIGILFYDLHFGLYYIAYKYQYHFASIVYYPSAHFKGKSNRSNRLRFIFRG